MRVSLPHFTAAVLLLLAVTTWPPGAAGQSLRVASGGGAETMLVLERGSASLAAAEGRPVTRSPLPHQARWLSAAAHAEFARRDPMRSGLWGAGIGAFIGAAGFATVTYFANEGGQGSEYWPLALGVGALAGGAAGFIVGISYAAW